MLYQVVFLKQKINKKGCLLFDRFMDTVDYISRQNMDFVSCSCMCNKIPHKFLIVRAAGYMAAFHSDIFTGK